MNCFLKEYKKKFVCLTKKYLMRNREKENFVMETFDYCLHYHKKAKAIKQNRKTVTKEMKATTELYCFTTY